MSASMIDFCKNEDCPSSNELLEFQVGELSQGRSLEVRRHLGTCEFCEAEVEFYSHYPQEEALLEQSEKIEIPAPLFELAEALLKNRNGDSNSLNDLLREKDGLILDKV
jgi:anti-sigma factor RsiW